MTGNGIALDWFLDPGGTTGWIDQYCISWRSVVYLGRKGSCFSTFILASCDGDLDGESLD
jgi:hypothetical protein